MVFANTFSGQNTPYSHPYFFSLPEFGSPNSLWPNYLSPLGSRDGKAAIEVRAAFEKLRLKQTPLLFHSRSIPDPGQILVPWARLIVVMVAACKSCNGPRIPPLMIFHMPIRKTNYPASIMRTVREIKETVLSHMHAEIRPANAVRINIHDREGSPRHRPR